MIDENQAVKELLENDSLWEEPHDWDIQKDGLFIRNNTEKKKRIYGKNTVKKIDKWLSNYKERK